MSAGLHPVAIARAERTRKDVKASTVAAIVKALGVPVCELFEESGHERRRTKRKARGKRPEEESGPPETRTRDPLIKSRVPPIFLDYDHLRQRALKPLCRKA